MRTDILEDASNRLKTGNSIAARLAVLLASTVFVAAPAASEPSRLVVFDFELRDWAYDWNHIGARNEAPAPRAARPLDHASKDN